MESMDIMGLDEQAKLFDSGNPYRASTSVHPVVLDGREDRFSSDLKNLGLAIGQIYGGQDGRASTDVSHRAKGNNDSGKLYQTAYRNEASIINKSNLGNSFAVEVIPNLPEDLRQDLGLKEKVSNFDSKSEENYISVFIGNLPPFANNRWIFDNFIKIVKVADYYVSGRLSKFSKKPFGFVRFHSLEDANKAVDHFNGAWVDGFKLEVELARFPRRLTKDEDNCNVRFSRVEQSSQSKGTKVGTCYAINQKAWLNPNRTFAQALVGNTGANMTDVGNSPMTRIKVKAEVKECDWLNLSVMAKIKWGTPIRNIRKLLLSNIKGLESVSRLGIRKLILSFVSLEDRNDAIICGDWLGLLEDVREWRGELVCADKLWSISCIGIPMNAWNIESFRSIAGVWGSLVYIDEALLKREDFRMANFMIETESEVINTCIDLIVGNEVFQITVIGERIENQVGNVNEDGKLKWINEKERSGLDTDTLIMSYANDTKICAIRQDENGANVSVLDLNNESHDKMAVFERQNGDLTCNSDCFEQNIKCVSDGLTAEQVVDFLVPNPDGQEQSAFEAKEECNDRIDVLRYDPKHQKLMAWEDSVNFDMPADDDSKRDAEQVFKLATEKECKTASDYDCSVSDFNILNTSNQIVCFSPIQDVRLAEVVKVSSFNMVQVDHILEKSENVNSYEMPAMGIVMLANRVVPDTMNGHQGSLVVNLSDANNEVTNQNNSILSCGVENEVKEMMDLGNLLDIPNAYRFEDAVRDTTTEEMMDDPNSIGGRVKSKRKYTGKSKVHFGCRIKKV